ncbi:MAG: hypothetical protein OXC82_10255 [Rhodobacteraceae bacterium]|nr:hypothetical protein [Paracoccaceae bacterium]
MGIGPEPGIVLKPKDSRGGSGPVSALGCRAYVFLYCVGVVVGRRIAGGAWRVPRVGHTWRHVVS